MTASVVSVSIVPKPRRIKARFIAPLALVLIFIVRGDETTA